MTSPGQATRLETRRQVTYHHLLLPRHEVLTADGLDSESFFLCDVARDMLNAAALQEISKCAPDVTLNRLGTGNGARMMLKTSKARFLAHIMGIAPQPVAAAQCARAFAA